MGCRNSQVVWRRRVGEFVGLLKFGRSDVGTLSLCALLSLGLVEAVEKEVKVIDQGNTQSTGCLRWIGDILESYCGLVFGARNPPHNLYGGKNMYILIFGIKKKSLFQRFPLWFSSFFIFGFGWKFEKWGKPLIFLTFWLR